MAQYPDRVSNQDYFPVLNGINRMLKGYDVGNAVISSGHDSWNFPQALTPVISEVGIPHFGLFHPEDREALIKRGFFVAPINLEHGVSDANNKFPLKVMYPGPELMVGDLPRVTEAAFYPGSSAIEMPENLGRSLAEQRKYATEYGKEVAADIKARGLITGVIGQASEIHQVLARYQEAHGNLPITDPKFPHLRTESYAGGGVGIVLKMDVEKNALVTASASLFTGQRVNEAAGSVIAWPFLMPAGAA